MTPNRLIPRGMVMMPASRKEAPHAIMPMEVVCHPQGTSHAGTPRYASGENTSHLDKKRILPSPSFLSPVLAFLGRLDCFSPFRFGGVPFRRHAPHAHRRCGALHILHQTIGIQVMGFMCWFRLWRTCRICYSMTQGEPHDAGASSARA